MQGCSHEILSDQVISSERGTNNACICTRDMLPKENFGFLDLRTFLIHPEGKIEV